MKLLASRPADPASTFGDLTRATASTSRAVPGHSFRENYIEGANFTIRAERSHPFPSDPEPRITTNRKQTVFKIPSKKYDNVFANAYTVKL